MSTEKKPQTREEKLASMQMVLKKYRRNIAKLQVSIHKTEVRLKGATKEVVQRRFTRDLREYRKQLTDLKGKESWAQRQIDLIRMAMSSDKKGNLKHNPFTALSSVKL